MIVFLLTMQFYLNIVGLFNNEDPISIPEQVESVFVDIGRPEDFLCAAYIFERESGWISDAVGDRGRSCGLGQRYTSVWGTPSLPWSIKDQVLWFTWYADNRYGGWCEAMDGWKRNRELYGWGWW